MNLEEKINEMESCYCNANVLRKVADDLVMQGDVLRQELSMEMLK